MEKPPMTLLSRTARLALDHPGELREALLPVLRRAGLGARTAARPIRLPERELRQIARELVNRLSSFGLPKSGRVVAELDVEIPNVKGDAVIVETVLMGSPSFNLEKHDLVQGAYLKRRRGDVPLMVIYTNPILSMESFTGMARRGLAEDEIYRVLAHELTHAADVFSGPGSVGDPKATKEEFKRQHHNHPAEVKALMRDVVTGVDESIDEYLEMGMPFKDALEGALDDSKWADIKDYLTRRNRQTILKGVYTHLRDRGLTGR